MSNPPPTNVLASAEVIMAHYMQQKTKNESGKSSLPPKPQPETQYKVTEWKPSRKRSFLRTSRKPSNCKPLSCIRTRPTVTPDSAPTIQTSKKMHRNDKKQFNLRMLSVIDKS